MNFKIGQRVRYTGPSFTLNDLFKVGYKNEAIVTKYSFGQICITFLDDHICKAIFSRNGKTYWVTSERFIEPSNTCKQLHFYFKETISF